RLNANVLAGRSGSVAAAVKVSRVPSLTVRLPIDDSVGDKFTSLTTRVTDWVALIGGVPLSVTITRNELVLGPWASVGVQVKTPLGELMLAPTGAPGSRLNARILVGISESVAVAVKVRAVCSLTV